MRNNSDILMTAAERRATWSLGTVFSLRMFGMFMVLPVLTTYGMALQDADETLIGIAIGIYGLMQALFQIPFGLWSDRIGRKPLITAGLCLFVIGSVVAALSDSIWGVILGRALQGSGAVSAALMALLSDLTREQNRTKAMAFIGISFGITFSLAMVSGPLITHAVGLSGLFWFIAVLAVCAVLVNFFAVPSPARHVRNRESALVGSLFWRVIKDRSLLKLNAGIFCMHFLLMSTFVAYPPALEQAGIPVAKHWQIYLITMLVAFACVLPPIIYAEVKRKMRRIFILCIISLAAAEGFLAFSYNRPELLIAGIQLFFIAFNLMEALLPSWVSKEAPAGCKGTAMGVYSTSQFFGVAAGGAAGGLMVTFAGTEGVFMAGILVSVVWLAISLTMREPRYLSSLRIELPEGITDADRLQGALIALPGVADVAIDLNENSVYVKTDNKTTDRKTLEHAVAACV